VDAVTNLLSGADERSPSSEVARRNLPNYLHQCEGCSRIFFQTYLPGPILCLCPRCLYLVCKQAIINREQ